MRRLPLRLRSVVGEPGHGAFLRLSGRHGEVRASWFATSLGLNHRRVLAGPPGMVLLEDANRLVRLEEDGVLKAALRGDLRPQALLANSGGRRSIRKVLINRDDLRRLADGPGSRGYTHGEAAMVLRMSRFTVGKLMGIIAPCRRRGRLSADDVRAIRNRFVTPREIAAARPELRSRAGFTAELATRGVRPALDDRGVNPLFDREAVGAVLGAIPIEALPSDFEAEQRSS